MDISLLLQLIIHSPLVHYVVHNYRPYFDSARNLMFIAKLVSDSKVVLLIIQLLLAVSF